MFYVSAFLKILLRDQCLKAQSFSIAFSSIPITFHLVYCYNQLAGFPNAHLHGFVKLPFKELHKWASPQTFLLFYGSIQVRGTLNG